MTYEHYFPTGINIQISVISYYGNNESIQKGAIFTLKMTRKHTLSMSVNKSKLRKEDM